MPIARGGFLIEFDEAQRTDLLRDQYDIEHGFSDALSAADWKIKHWEVCGLMFEPGIITHWALARRGKKVATSKARVEFSEVAPVRVLLGDIEHRMRADLRRFLVRARSGIGGIVPPETWTAVKIALGEVDAAALKQLEDLERLRDSSQHIVARPGSQIVAFQRDAVGLALDAHDGGGESRKEALSKYRDTGTKELRSFLESISGVRSIEDQLIARDAAVFPETRDSRHTVAGTVFDIGGRKLEVFNVNRTAIEKSLGVDLLYHLEELDAWTLVQYKAMDEEGRLGEKRAVFRPDARFDAEFRRMNSFCEDARDEWKPECGHTGFRLCGDGFYFKFCSRVQLEVLSTSLLPGMYLPRRYIAALMSSDSTLGPGGGRLLTFENTGRHINNTLFADLVRDGWIGTRGVSSEFVARIVREGLALGRSFVVARSRPKGARANPRETLDDIGLVAINPVPRV